ncbi:MAG: Peptidyl-prolyl cis-trans isomerase [Mucilaginibacter sp.]|nr:Peptidyl-prolyl cis-trans isomerase [Mucilaginibacter sp.]
MKHKIFTFLLIAAAGLTACRKTGTEPDIKQYDDQQIQGYIAANGLTGFSKDTTGGDTTGMYYKIINKGVGVPLEYSDLVSIVFTRKSFDGKYTLSDTIINHIYNYLGHLYISNNTTSANLPKGLMLGIKNILKYRDGSMRLLIPSRLAYGTVGYGSGSVTNVNTRIAGNQSLDYYVHVINDQQVYDDLVIRNYMTANALSGYTKTATGIYYKILKDKTPGTYIDDFSTIVATYSGALLNNTYIDQASITTAATLAPATTFAFATLAPGVHDTLQSFAGEGTSISMLIPSRLMYGAGGSSNGTIPSNAPLRFEWQISTVTH